MKKSPYIIMLLILISLIIIFEIAPLLGLLNQPCFHESLIKRIFCDRLVPPACLGSTLAYLLLIPIRKKELIVATIVGIIFEIILGYYRPTFIWPSLGYQPEIGPLYQLTFIGPGLLTGYLLAILGRIFQAHKSGNAAEQQTNLEILSLSVAMPTLLCFDVLTSNQDVYDSHLYALDSLWGGQASFIITKFLRHNSLCSYFMEIIYYYLPLWMISAQVLVYRHNTKLGLPHNRYLIPAFLFIIVAIGGLLSYHFIPAIGVELYCGADSFPNCAWPPASIAPQPTEVPSYLHRNSMPSLHFAWILAAYYSLYRFKSIYKNIALVFVFLTALSAFSVGGHYVIDLIMSVPFCTAALAIAIVEAPRKIRLLSGIWGIIATISWFCLFKYDTTTLLAYPLATKWSLSLTDLVSFILLYMLCQQSYQKNFPPSKQY